jgi:hypothetical protein
MRPDPAEPARRAPDQGHGFEPSVLFRSRAAVPPKRRSILTNPG